MGGCFRLRQSNSFTKLQRKFKKIGWKEEKEEGRKVILKIKDCKTLEINEVSPTIVIAIAYCRESFQAATQRGRTQVELKNYLTWQNGAEIFGRKQEESSHKIQYQKGEHYKERKLWRSADQCPQVISSVLSAHVYRNTTQRKNHTIKNKGNSDWSPHRAKNRTLFPAAILDNLKIDGTTGNTSRRVLPQEREIIIRLSLKYHRLKKIKLFLRNLTAS